MNASDLIERDIDAYLEAHEHKSLLSVGETMFPPQAPFFGLASCQARVRSGESAVSPPRASGRSSTNREVQRRWARI